MAKDDKVCEIIYAIKFCLSSNQKHTKPRSLIKIQNEKNFTLLTHFITSQKSSMGVKQERKVLSAISHSSYHLEIFNNFCCRRFFGVDIID